MSKEVTIKHTYKLKRGKEEALIALNPMLLDGEPIVAFMEDGSVNMKVGDGVHTYNELDWIKGDDTPTVPFIDLGYIGESDFNNALDTLPQMDCIGVCHIASPGYIAYFEQWITQYDDGRISNIKQTKKLHKNCGFVERYKIPQSDGTWLWSDWQPITIDITDIGNHFDSTKLDNVLDQLGNNQVIDLGTFTSNSALSGYNWEEGKHYRFYLDGYWAGYYTGHCNYEALSGSSVPVLYLHNYADGSDFRCEVRWGNNFYPCDPYTAIYNSTGQHHKLAHLLNSTLTRIVSSFDELLAVANEYADGKVFCIELNTRFNHTSGNTLQQGRYICIRDNQAGIASIVMVNLTKGIFYRLGTETTYFTEENIVAKQGRYVTAIDNYFNGRTVEEALQQLGNSEIINLGTLSTYNDLENVEWQYNRLYQFTVSGDSIGVPEGVYFCTSPQIDKWEDDDDDLYYSYRLNALNLQNYEWYLIRYRSDKSNITSVAKISNHTESRINSQITYAFTEEQFWDAQQLYRYLYIRFRDNSYLHPHNSICGLNIKVSCNGGIYLNSTNTLPIDSYRVDGILLYEGTGYAVYKIYFTSISSGKIYYGSIDLYDKPSAVDNERSLSFTNVGIITIPDSTIVDVNDYFTNNTIEGALNELGSERIIDIGEITSTSALTGYSNWIDGRVYNVEFSDYSIASGAYNKKQQFIYYANADGSGDVATGYADGHYIESVHTYENNCRLRVYIRSGYPYEIVHDNDLLMYPIGTNTGSITSYSQNKAIKYLRDYLDSYVYRQIPDISNQVSNLTKFKSISTLDELKTYLTEEYNKHQGTKPVYVDFYNYYYNTIHTTPFVTKCVGTVFSERGSYSYKGIDITNQNSIYFAGYMSKIVTEAESVKFYRVDNASEFSEVLTYLDDVSACIIEFRTDNTKGIYMMHIDKIHKEAYGIKLDGTERIILPSIFSEVPQKVTYTINCTANSGSNL